MNDVRNATADSLTALPTADAARARKPMVTTAPGPEIADVRDKGGAQLGMIIMIVGGGAFWTAAAALAVHLLK
jgi:hypothetical protein